jgi:hypothetical protein
MEFEHAAIALLASMVLVLAGMVGWIYWQQTRMFQNMNNIVMVVGELAASREEDPMAMAEEPAVEDPAVEDPVADPEDDRASVDADVPNEPILITGPPADDTDGLEDKSKKDLQALLVKRGIPFGKADNKNALISLLKATS